MREALSDVLLSGVKDPRVNRGLVTVTSVDVAPDLKSAYVYVSILGDDRTADDALAGLASAAGYLRRELGRLISTKSTPALRFRMDPALASGARVEGLLGEIHGDEGHNGEEEA